MSVGWNEKNGLFLAFIRNPLPVRVEAFQIVGPCPRGVDVELARGFEVLELGVSVKRKLKFVRVEHFEEDDFVLRRAQWLQGGGPGLRGA